MHPSAEGWIEVDYDEYRCPRCGEESDGAGSLWPANCEACGTEESVCPWCQECITCEVGPL